MTPAGFTISRIIRVTLARTAVRIAVAAMMTILYTCFNRGNEGGMHQKEGDRQRNQDSGFGDHDSLVDRVGFKVKRSN